MNYLVDAQVSSDHAVWLRSLTEATVQIVPKKRGSRDVVGVATLSYVKVQKQVSELGRLLKRTGKKDFVEGVADKPLAVTARRALPPPLLTADIPARVIKEPGANPAGMVYQRSRRL